MAVGLECVFVFVKSYCQAPFSLTHVRFLTVGARESVYSWTCVSVCCLLFVH